ncbi:hypothetical protein LEN26_016055 [Aphanomyces euteiches]|nr:hypothetical protein LEN26_016055 [Aphanomyces euteiches]KAH9109677.1 hypothetical protein AeMF1_015294 [Aphanomyces euteiches]
MTSIVTMTSQNLPWALERLYAQLAVKDDDLCLNTAKVGSPVAAAIDTPISDALYLGYGVTKQGKMWQSWKLLAVRSNGEIEEVDGVIELETNKADILPGIQGLLNHDESIKPRAKDAKSKTQSTYHYKLNKRLGDVSALSDNHKYVIDTSMSQDGQFIVVCQDSRFTYAQFRLRGEENASGRLHPLSITTSDEETRSCQHVSRSKIDPFCLI